MTNQPDKPGVLLPRAARTAPLQSFLQTSARAAGALAVLIGLVVLVGWAFGLRTLTTLSPTWPPMMVGTAAASVLCGAALILLPRPSPPDGHE